MSLINIIIAILVLGVIVLIHELGHFVLAKLNDVNVEEFSIGMGPKILGFKGKETQYSLRILPIGGYVKMLGEEEKSDDPRAYNNKSPLRRLSIVSAGPIMNIILAAVLYALIAQATGFVSLRISAVSPKSPAELAGIKVGDTIIKANNSKMLTWDDFSLKMYLNKSNNINVTVKRNGEIKNFNIKPMKNTKENRYMIGVGPTNVKNPSVIEGIKYGFNETIFMVKEVFISLKMLFTGKLSAQDVSGPVSIIRVTGAAANAGLVPLISFMAFLSANVGLFNLLPIPALDGSYVILFLIQIITGKKIDDNKVGVINTIGFALLMALMVIVTIKDILYPLKI
ncbi:MULTISPECIES: RIP metalloprotease RseP [Clostridium]|uniref:RIP metalloprotease RseP n=1 Tax=Clostridium TaxID=1485 RepID=UPI000A059E7A|nr:MULTISPECIES: RIP metalloprotease RseP [Clostridium]MCD2345973.1 RIP metalloprotease RseP [Clostridium guangxiense]